MQLLIASDGRRLFETRIDIIYQRLISLIPPYQITSILASSIVNSIRYKQSDSLSAGWKASPMASSRSRKG